MAAKRQAKATQGAEQKKTAANGTDGDARLDASKEMLSRSE